MNDDDDELLAELGPAITPPVPPPDPARLEAIREAAAAAPAADAVALRSRRSLLRGAAAAVGGVAAGSAATFLLVDDDQPAGPPLESARLQTAPGIEASANLIAHTWGLEVLLDVSGLEPGSAYDMTFVARDGRRVAAGGMVGTDGLVRCRNNGPILRAEVARFVVTGPDGSEPVRAELT
ncbi:hypothetical protein BH10ACT1_BH10ACT1_32030 [soil metagenome]